MIYIVQCDPEVPPGLIGVELREMQADRQLIRLDEGGQLPVAHPADMMIVLGGRMSANDDRQYPFLAELKRWIRTAVEKQVPYLGICLGGQLLAAALGSRVVGNRWGERGNSEVLLTREGSADRLFRGLPQKLVAFQWHDDSFDLPQGATLLASSAVCPHQAFRVANAWGLQFHPEVTPEIISGWAASEPSDAETGLLSGWLEREKEYRSTAEAIMKNFLSLNLI